MSAPRLVDWDLAVATACRLVPPGPAIGYAAAEAVVVDLRAAAVEAEEHVSALTSLTGDPTAGPVVVVDRPDWIRSNITGFRLVVDPLAEQLLSARGVSASAAVTAIGSRVAAVQVGALLSYLATRVLGQYEVFLPPGQGSGRLSLVAPNIVETERRLGVDPRDFRRWVALHEVTHRTQFTAVPWLREHVLSEISAFLLASDLDPAALAARLRDALVVVADAARHRGERSLIEIVQTPEQRVILDRLTGFMSLVEGHAEYVMDEVGERLVRSVPELRRRFEDRRATANPLERMVRRLFGIDLKLKQYAEGAAFVRAVVSQVGMAGFNRIWASARTLPTGAEIRDPAAWLRRVPGVGSAIESA
ncbi:MAG TPA: zinc-dependent metalloprotease [Mycobacteriales bacterium]|nr:zinc-dependent metalloprotease [Mycobacteriales bacterium]